MTQSPRVFLRALPAAILLTAGAFHVGSVHGRPRLIGVLTTGSNPDATMETGSPRLGWFRNTLNELGHREGDDVALMIRVARGRTSDARPDAAGLERAVREMVDSGVEVIVAGGSTEALAAKQVTRTIPIVFWSAEPITEGLVESLEHPGENATGVIRRSDTFAQQLRALDLAAPGSAPIGFLFNPTYAPGVGVLRLVRRAADSLGIRILVAEARDSTALAAAFDTLHAAGVRAVFVGNHGLFRVQAPAIAALAARHKLPMLSPYPEARDAGVLVTSIPDFAFWSRRAASYVDRILQGAAPADMPVEQSVPMKFTVNEKTAATLGVDVAEVERMTASSVVRTQTVDWPVYGGSDDHTHYTTLAQITPANVKTLKVAWTYDTHDAFQGSEMQTNPIVIDGVLYGTSPKLRVFALDAATGRELWSFDPNYGAPPTSRIRHRGVVVTGDRVLFNFRNRLYALDRSTGRPIRTFGDTGWVDLRAGLGRPVEGLSVSASSPGVVFEGLLIMGSTVPEALPSAPGDIRAYDVQTSALRWSFHTIPHPGEPGYETWPPETWKIAGGVNAWSGVTLDAKRAMVFVATGSASYDFYGANRIGDDLYANSVIALDARTGKHIWHYQVIRHDLWDRDLPAAPVLVTVRRGGRLVDAVAQITKTGHVYLFDRESGALLFPVKEYPMPPASLAGDRAADSQHFPIAPPPFTRQRLTVNDLTTRTSAAHASALKLWKEFGTRHPFEPPNAHGTIIFPGVDGGGEWGGPAFDPQTGLLYVNANEMAWLLKLAPRSDKSLYAANCASCHGENRQGSAMAPSLAGVGARRSADQIAQIIREGTGRMPAFGSALESRAVADLVRFLVTGRDSAIAAGPDPFGVPWRNAYFDIFLDHEGYPAIKPPWGTLNAIDLNAGTIRWSIPFGEYPALAARGLRNTGTDNYGGAIVTENGLLFIAATTYDDKIRAFDKLTGKLLWSAKLPAAGNATPAMYVVDGRQYLVIACGGGKNGAKSGGTYVAFALPVSDASRRRADQ